MPLHGDWPQAYNHHKPLIYKVNYELLTNTGNHCYYYY